MCSEAKVRKEARSCASRPMISTLQPLIQVILQLAAAAGVTQLAQSLGFDLTNTLAGHMELFADFFQRAATAIVQAEAQLEHFAFAVGQALKHIFHLLFEQL